MLQQEEQQRKSWEMKAVASEKQLEQLQVRQALAEPRWLVARGQLAEAKQEHGALPDVSPLILSGLLHLRVVLVILSEKRMQEGGRREGELTRRAKPRGVLGLGPYVVFFLLLLLFLPNGNRKRQLLRGKASRNTPSPSAPFGREGANITPGLLIPLQGVAHKRHCL